MSGEPPKPDLPASENTPQVCFYLSQHHSGCCGCHGRTVLGNVGPARAVRLLAAPGSRADGKASCSGCRGTFSAAPAPPPGARCCRRHSQPPLCPGLLPAKVPTFTCLCCSPLKGQGVPRLNTTQVFLSIRLERLLDGKCRCSWLPGRQHRAAAGFGRTSAPAARAAAELASPAMCSGRCQVQARKRGHLLAVLVRPRRRGSHSHTNGGGCQHASRWGRHKQQLEASPAAPVFPRFNVQGCHTAF